MADDHTQVQQSKSLGMVTVADPEQCQSLFQNLMAIGQKVSPATQEYLARQATVSASSTKMW